MIKTYFKAVLFIFCLSASSELFAQSGNISMNLAGAATTNPAILDLSDPSNAHLGFLLPKVALSGVSDNTTIPAPTTGMIVWNTSPSPTMPFGPGFYFWAGQWYFLFNSQTPTINFSGNLAGDVTGTQAATSVVKILGNTVPANAQGAMLNNGSGTLSWGMPLPRVNTIASSASPSPVASTTDEFTVTALATGATFGNPGTGVAGQKLVVRIKDNGTTQALSFPSPYRGSTDLALPTATTVGKTLYLGFLYNEASSTWDLVARINGF